MSGPILSFDRVQPFEVGRAGWTRFWLGFLRPRPTVQPVQPTIEIQLGKGRVVTLRHTKKLTMYKQKRDI